MTNGTNVQVTLIKRSVPVCPGCLVMKTMLEGEGVAHNVIDITVDPGASSRYGLTGIPVVLVDKGDGITSMFTGVTPIEIIKEAMGE